MIFMHQNPESAFLHKARAVFAESLDRLDTRVLARLHEDRARAVAAATRHRAPWRPRTWLLPSGTAAAVLVAIVCGILWWNHTPQPGVPFATGNNEDMAIVLGNDNLDMYADMDFYRWLQTQQKVSQQTEAGGGSRG